MGAWLQLTGGALIGRFDPRAQGTAKRFLRDGVVHLLASDGHNLKNRTPELAAARAAAAELVGEAEAERLVCGRPQAILDNVDPATVPLPEVDPPVPAVSARRALFSRLLGRG